MLTGIGEESLIIFQILGTINVTEEIISEGTVNVNCSGVRNGFGI
jgi:hypothetical protein